MYHKSLNFGKTCDLHGKPSLYWTVLVKARESSCSGLISGFYHSPLIDSQEDGKSKKMVKHVALYFSSVK
jgi:hypothetical protein